MRNFIRNLKNIQLPFISPIELYFDLGTSNTRIAVKDKGIVLSEPTVLGFNKKTREYIFFGREAQLIIGKVPEFISVEQPIINSIISDFDAEAALVAQFLSRGVGPYLKNYPFLKPPFDAIVAVPPTATEIEQKAVEEVLFKVGVRRVALVEKPIATAIGCGYNVFAHNPVFVIDLGGGLIEMAVISGGGIVIHKSIRNAGDHMNKLIANYTYLKHGLILGELTCEDLKCKLLDFTNDEKTLVVRGKSLETGLPKSVKMKTSDIKEALLANINQIVDAVKEIVELSPPEVVDSIFSQGITITGGLAHIPGLDEFFTRELEITVSRSQDVDYSTIHGLMRIGRRRDTLEKVKIAVP